MAKLSVTVVPVVILFFSSTLSNARVPLDLPENDVINSAIQNSRQESDIRASIRLPSETSGDGPRAHDDSHNEVSKPTTTTAAAATVTAVPLKAVRFRPINRHFRLGSSLPFRLCHHHHHHHHHHHYQHHFKPMGQRPEIPYDDDMIFATVENNDVDPMFYTGSLREVEPTWVWIHHHNLHHHGDQVDDIAADNEFSRLGAEKFNKFGKEKKFRKYFRRGEYEEGREKTTKDDQKMKREAEGGFLKHFRKFLNQFEF